MTRPTIVCFAMLLAAACAPAYAAAVTCCAEENSPSTEESPCWAAVDGNPGTVWHTPYTGDPPHWIELRFPEKGRVVSCSFTHRPDGENGTPASTVEPIDGNEITLWPNGPDGTVVSHVFSTPIQIQHNDHPLTFYFAADYRGGRWTALAEIDCDFVPDQEPTVEMPCENTGHSPTPTFAFEWDGDEDLIDGFGIYVAEGGGDWELRHVLNCGYAVQEGEAIWTCPQRSFAIQRYLDLPPCSIYTVGVGAIGRDEWVDPLIITDDATWVWERMWVCEPIPNGCSPTDIP